MSKSTPRRSARSLLQQLLLAQPVKESERRQPNQRGYPETTSTESRVGSGAADSVIFSEVGNR
jgi:hypothetical protein